MELRKLNEKLRHAWRRLTDEETKDPDHTY